jgi:hypothetical protein
MEFESGLQRRAFRSIMESIQRMTHESSPLVTLAQQGAETANYVIVERWVGNPQGEPYVGKQSHDRAKRARSEPAASNAGVRSQP